jgi:hypothetical protein
VKKVLSSILISFIIFANLFAPFSVGITKSKLQINKSELEAANCVFTKISTTPDLSGNTLSPFPEKISLNIETSADCVGKFFKGFLKKGGTWGGPVGGAVVLNILPREITSSKFSIDVKPGEQYCSGGDCIIAMQFFLLQNGDASDTEIDKYQSGDKIGPDNEIKYLCSKDNCDDSIKWSLIDSQGTAESVGFSMIPSSTSNSVTVTGLGPVMIANANGGSGVSPDDTITIEIYDDAGISVPGLKINPIKYNVLNDLTKDLAISYAATFEGLEPVTSYTVKLTTNFRDIPDLKNKEYKISGIFTRDESGTVVVPLPGSIDKRGTAQNNPTGAGAMPECSIIFPVKIGGCFAQIFYYVLFIPTSYLFALSGVFFDNTFAYSVQDTSYRSAFVVQGWGLVRDFCNMLFIFILLYVAIGTILSLHSMKTKETIINVVIIGLFINFSLFATQLIIDASNITARVFYNADTIEITEDGANFVTNTTPGGAKPTKDGVLPLSTALVNKVNPQNLIIHAEQINKVGIKGGDAVIQDEEGSMTAGTFIIVVLIASAVNIVGFIVFLTVGMLFIARVIGLWMAMILAPIAFFTYILPEQTAGIKMIGWKNWWPETLKMAFLAPVFIFFMYIILKFLELDLIADAKNKDGLTFFIATLMPFAFIMIMLMKAKKIATDMAGEMGAFATKVGSSIGGVALGLATGGAAMAMRGTVGKLGDKLANSSIARQPTRFGAMVKNIGTKTAASTFDVRNTKLGAEAGKGLGVDMGKAKEGGYTKHKEDVQKKAEERAKQLEVGHNEHLMHELHAKEEAFQVLKNKNSGEIAKLDGKIASGQTDANDKITRANNLEAIVKNAEAAGQATEEQKEAARKARKEATEASDEVKANKDKKAAIKNGAVANADGTYDTDNGKISEKGLSIILEKERDATIRADAADRAVTDSENMVIAAENELNTAQNNFNNAPAVAAAALATETTAIDTALATETAAINATLAKELADVDRMENEAKRKAGGQLNAAQISYFQDTRNQANTKATTETNAVNTKHADDTAAANTRAQESVNTAQAAFEAAQTSLAEAKNKLTEAEIAQETAQAEASNAISEATTARVSAAGGFGKSMNQLEFEDIPDANFAISTENHRRKTQFANNVENRWFNKEANRHASHNIRMGAEIKPDGHH